MKKAIAITILIIMCTNIVMADFIINGIDYISPKNEVINYGINAWHDNHTEGTVVLPLKEAWTLTTGKTMGQILISENLVFAYAGGKLSVIVKDTGQKLNEMYIDNNELTQTSPLLIKHSKEKYQIIIPSINKIVSIEAIIKYNKEKILAVNLKKNWEWHDDNKDNDNMYHINSSDILTKSLSLLKDHNTNIEKKYICFGTTDGRMIALDSDTGLIIPNGEIKGRGILGTGIIYDGYSSIIYAGNEYVNDKGFLSGCTILNGVLNKNILYNDNNFLNEMGGLSFPTAHAKYNDINTGEEKEIVFISEKNGTLIGFNQIENELLFKITKYEGMPAINGMTISGKHLILTYMSDINGKGKIACVNYERAIYDAQYNPQKKVNDNIIFEQNLEGYTYTSSLALSAMENNTNTEIFFTANKNDKESIVAYYLDKYDATNKRPISIKAFDDNGIIKSAIDIEGGIISQLSYAGGHLIFIDGKGIMHAYTSSSMDNLSVMNFKNSSKTVEKGKEYTATLNLVNYTMRDRENIEIEYTINDSLKHKAKLNFGPNGVIVHFKYKIPKDYDKKQLKITVELNKENRPIEETTYDDNNAILILDVADNIDLEVTKINYKKYPIGLWALSTITVKNNSMYIIMNVPVKITSNGVVKVEKINMFPNSTISVPFLIKTPSSRATFEIKGEINDTKVYSEVNYDNNVMRINSTTSDNVYFENQKDKVTWKEIDVVEGEKEYWASLEADATLEPNPAKSGSGFNVIVSSKVKTNYNKPNLVTGAQTAYVEFNGKTYSMQGGGSEKEQSFILRENPDSILYDKEETRHLTRKIYTPANLPDGTYNLKIVVKDAISPGGYMQKVISKTVIIKGNMYENDYTSPKSK